MKSSVILSSRNDNYGGNLHKRTTMALTSMIENHDEVVFVDWKTKNGEGVISNIKHNLPHTKKLKYRYRYILTRKILKIQFLLKLQNLKQII